MRTSRRNGDPLRASPGDSDLRSFAYPKGDPVRISFLAYIVALVVLISGLAALDLGSRPVEAADQASPWIYLRGEEVPSPSEKLVELLVVGDVMLGRGVASEREVFGDVAARLRSADLALGNFEGVVPPEGWGAIPTQEWEAVPAAGEPETGGRSAGVSQYSPYRLLIPAGALSQLQAAGFDLLSLANNHALDAGEAGLANTARLLGRAGIASFGIEADPSVLPLAAVRRVNGLSIAVLSFNLIPPGASSPAEIVAAIRQARSEADAIVVLVHWGWEYQLHVDPAQRALAQSMEEAGADLILGSHPHVVQDLEVLHGQTGCALPNVRKVTTENTEHAKINAKNNSAISACSAVNTKGSGREVLVAYSLGNFVFDQGQGETGQGLALRAFLDADGLRAVQALPVWAGLRPHWMEAGEAATLLDRISPPPPRHGYACDDSSCLPVPVPLEEISGLYWSGTVDLTGDGVPEIVRREGERAAIYQDGDERPVWESPPDWRVADLATGDPNDDGRNELLLALYKRSPGGGESSHPFVLGYRGGTYRVLWGGSAVSEPLLEVELGDLDGDGVQELVALEESAVSVWRWHGWGFALLWRSPTGSYRDLALIPQEGGTRIITFAARYVQTE